MIALTDAQLSTVMQAARGLPVEARSNFLQLVADQLKVKDVDVADAADRAVRLLLERRGNNPNHAKPVLHL
jgi:hypothetical protein